MSEPEHIIYAPGLVCCSVCSASSDVEAITTWLNRTSPTGSTSQWSLSDKPFSSGVPNPCPCDDTPGRRHYLFVCLRSP